MTNATFPRLVRAAWTAVLAGSIALFAGTTALAQDARDALKDQSIRFIIAASAGGGSDQIGRMLAAALGRALPETAVHVQNRGGAGGGLAMSEVENATGKLVTLGFSNNGPIYIQLSETAAAQFDLAKLKWIGSVGDNQRLLVMRAGLGPPTLETLMNLDRPPILAMSGSAGSAGYVEAMLLNAILALRAKVAADVDDPVVHALMLAGDVDLTLASYASLKPMLDAGDVLPVLIYSREGAPDGFEDVPSLADIVTQGEFKDVVRLLESLSRSGRIVVASPATSPDQLAALRAAFDLAVVDPQYEAEMGAGSYVVNASPGAEIEERIEGFLGISGGFKATFKRYLECGERISAGAATGCE